MNSTPHIPQNPDDVLDLLAPVLEGIYAGLDNGVSLADQKFADMDYDAALWSHIVRHGACSYLGGLESDGWSFGPRLANSGLQVTCGPFLVRVLKAQCGGPPNPGRNPRRIAFYTQGQLELPLDLEEVGLRPCANLIVDWSIDCDSRALALALSKPVGVWPYGGRPRLEWRRAISLEVDGGLAFRGAPELNPDAGTIFDDDELEAHGDVAQGDA